MKQHLSGIESTWADSCGVGIKKENSTMLERVKEFVYLWYLQTEYMPKMRRNGVKYEMG